MRPACVTMGVYSNRTRFFFQTAIHSLFRLATLQSVATASDAVLVIAAILDSVGMLVLGADQILSRRSLAVFRFARMLSADHGGSIAIRTMAMYRFTTQVLRSFRMCAYTQKAHCHTDCKHQRKHFL